MSRNSGFLNRGFRTEHAGLVYRATLANEPGPKKAKDNKVSPGNGETLDGLGFNQPC